MVEDSVQQNYRLNTFVFTCSRRSDNLSSGIPDVDVADGCWNPLRAIFTRQMCNYALMLFVGGLEGHALLAASSSRCFWLIAHPYHRTEFYSS